MMIPEHQKIHDKIDSFREEYKTADADLRKKIVELVKDLYKQLPQIPENCINCNMKKALPPEDEHGRFCGEPCHTEWADRTYGVKRITARPTLAQMRKRLGEMAKEEQLRKTLGKQQSLL